MPIISGFPELIECHIPNKLISLRSFYRYCQVKGLNNKNPTSPITNECKTNRTHKTTEDSMWQQYDLEKTREVIRHYQDDHEYRLTKHTLYNHVLGLHQFFEYCKINYDQVIPKDIRAWVSILSEQEYALGTIAKKLRGLRLFYQYCRDEELLSKDPTVRSANLKLIPITVGPLIISSIVWL